MASKYDPLRDHLTAQPDRVVEMTFPEIDRLVDGGLPPSAYKYQAWWANERGGTHTQRLAWLDAGRKTVQLDLNAGRVRFVRDQAPSPPGGMSTRGAPVVVDLETSDDDLVTRAAKLAAEVHEGDYRKGTKTPYFPGHLVPVARLVEKSEGNDVQIAAAYLHDAVEDEGGQAMLDRIRDEMGDDVAQIVEDLSDSLVDTSTTDKEAWEVRKPRYLATLALAQRASLEVSLADKVHNAQSILKDYKKKGEELWDRFNKPAEYQLWYYRKLAGLFTMRLPAHPLTPVLDDTVAELTALVRETTPDIDAKVIKVSGDLG